jgi:aminomethyltransferase
MTTTSIPLLRTPLYDTHVASGARIVPFAGWDMPVQYKGVLPEVKAVREAAGLFDVSHMGRVRVAGPEAFAYLQHLVVSDVSKLPDAGGAAQYSLLCLEAGGIIDDIIIYRLAPELFIVVVNASNRDKDVAWMRGHAANFKVTLDDETIETALIAVQGPQAIALVNSLSDADIPSMARFGVIETAVADIPVMIARTGYTGEDGVELFCAADKAAELWATLAEKGGVPCGLGARDTLRLEAALPLYGHEMDEHVHPYEARLGWVVKTDKDADFLGKGTLSELKETPRVKVLVGIEVEGRGIPREGYTLMVGDKAIGHITSGTFSPMKNKGVAMARVDAAYSKKNTAVDVLIRETRHAARVVALPFYKNV